MSNASTGQPRGAGADPAAALGSSSVLRGLFLACSWTWCIGMFLPILLVRDFGWPGWVAFAVPNVIGAISVGFVFRASGSAALTADRHSVALRLFSVWTVLFHVAFLSWILTLVFPWLAFSMGEIVVGGVTVWPASMGDGVGAVAVVALLLIVALMLSGMRTAGWMLGALAVYVMSVVFAVMAWRTTGGRAYAAPPIAGDERFPAIVGAASVMAIGFLTAPHMDLTILRTRHELPGRPGTVAFVIGFGVFFLSMIGLTLAYSTTFLGGLTSYYLVAHIVGQSVFTMSAHLRELRTGSIERAAGRGFPPLLAATLLLSIVCLGAVRLAYTGAGQTMYELFLAPYALIFPAYAWIVMVPHRRLTRGADWSATRGARLGLFALASLLASPALWYAAIGEPKRWVWASVGAGIVVLAPVFLALMISEKRAKPTRIA